MYEHPILEKIVIVLGVLLVCAAFIGAIVGGSYVLGKYGCEKLSENTGIRTEYHYIGGGCLVEVNGRLIPRENWRGEYEQ